MHYLCAYGTGHKRWEKVGAAPRADPIVIPLRLLPPLKPSVLRRSRHTGYSSYKVEREKMGDLTPYQQPDEAGESKIAYLPAYSQTRSLP